MTNLFVVSVPIMPMRQGDAIASAIGPVIGDGGMVG
jgi:hypothetical protein